LASQFSDFTNSDGSFVKCLNRSKIIVFAKDKVFVDRTISPPRGVGVDYELAVVSPLVEVTNDIVIDLSGLAGADGAQ